jgi:hypothetical protein
MPGITHPFVSAIADSGDSSIVEPSDWNATHTGAIWQMLTADFTVPQGAPGTFGNITNLTGLAIAANEKWSIAAYFFYNCTTGTGAGIDWQLTGPASPSNVRGVLQQPNTTSATLGRTAVTALSTAYGIATGANTLTGVLAELYVTIENGANAGTINFQVRTKTNVSGTILRGSYYTAWRMA